MQRFIKWFLITVFTAALSWAFLNARVGWNHTLSDFSGFRQTQTAITSYYMLRGGPFFSYETPVVGAPWSIPFEFPLYQWIVAAVCRSFHTRLEATGRFINELFFALTLLAMYGVLAELRVRPLYRLVFLTLTIVSPIYLFWSRTFLIESTALFFCLAYLFFFLRYMRARRPVDALLGVLCGAVGAVVKVTTFPGFALLCALFYIFSLRHELRPLLTLKPLLHRALPVLAFFFLPVLAVWAWTYHADQQKALNTFGAHLTSTALMEYNFGPLRQRFLATTWSSFFLRIVPDILGSNVIGLLPLVGLYFVRHTRLPFIICVGIFLFPFLLFTNHYLIDSYYSYANGIFLVAAIAWCIVGLLESTERHQLVGAALLLLCALNSIASYHEHGYRLQIGPAHRSHYKDAQYSNALHLMGVAQAVGRATQPQDVILGFGHDWSSEIPYYSRRRAVMWPHWMGEDVESPPLKETISKLGPTRIGALVVCGEARRNSLLIEQWTTALAFPPGPVYEDSACAVFSSQASSLQAP